MTPTLELLLSMSFLICYCFTGSGNHPYTEQESSIKYVYPATVHSDCFRQLHPHKSEKRIIYSDSAETDCLPNWIGNTIKHNCQFVPLRTWHDRKGYVIPSLGCLEWDLFYVAQCWPHVDDTPGVTHVVPLRPNRPLSALLPITSLLFGPLQGRNNI